MEIQMSSFQTEGLLSVVQFFTAQKNTIDYISLSEALKNELILVKEKDEGADVNNLSVFNLSKKPVFLMDGDILEGAKQNRVINSSVLLAPDSKGNLPVSCVEQGRWRFVSDKFKPADYTAPAKIRSDKSISVNESLKSFGVHSANQSKVWDNANKYHTMNNVESDSDNFSDLYFKHRENIDNIIKNFEADKKSNGFAVFIKNTLLSMDIFNRTDIFEEYFPKMIKGALFEVINLKKVKNPITQLEAEYKTRELTDLFDELPYKTYDSISLGQDIRYESNIISASELRFNNDLIHLTALNLN